VERLVFGREAWLLIPEVLVDDTFVVLVLRGWRQTLWKFLTYDPVQAVTDCEVTVKLVIGLVGALAEFGIVNFGVFFKEEFSHTACGLKCCAVTLGSLGTTGASGGCHGVWN
jgi:hypothetical protein